MSGHSKWATIHRQKEANDARKGAAFTKLAMNIMVAVREGGGIGDPNQNFRLRLAVDRARQLNMPKDNIARAIEKASGASAEALQEALFEGFLPGGAGVLVSTLSDNKLRTQQQVREVIDKNGGSMASSGAVSHMFSQVGELTVKYKAISEKPLDEQELEMIDTGVDEVERDEGGFIAYCDKTKTYEMKEKLEKLGYTIESAEVMMKPTVQVAIDDLEVAHKVEMILTKLSDLDDVQKVWTNYN